MITPAPRSVPNKTLCKCLPRAGESVTLVHTIKIKDPLRSVANETLCESSVIDFFRKVSEVSLKGINKFLKGKIKKEKRCLGIFFLCSIFAKKQVYVLLSFHC